MEKSLLIVFVKNPRPGKVKTRLAASIGDEKALRIYQLLLEHTLRVTRHLETDKAVFYSEFMPANDVWKKAGFKQFVQSGNDLGEKMSHAFRSSFIRGYDRVVLIGSDCYELDEPVLSDAFEKLRKNQVVTGPATDGGYYLIGMNEHFPELFQNKTWSTQTVHQETLHDIKKLGLTNFQLPEMGDIDILEDLMKHEDLFAML